MAVCLETQSALSLHNRISLKSMQCGLMQTIEEKVLAQR